MNIVFSDDDGRLTEEIKQLMQRALNYAIDSELREVFDETGDRASDYPVELSVSIVSADEIQLLNYEFRGIDRVTDVLSFPQFEDAQEIVDVLCGLDIDDDMGMLLGDVVICYDRAIEQSEEYGTGTLRELVYLFVHSIFHLLGYDHEEESERRLMRAREEAVLGEIGVVR